MGAMRRRSSALIASVLAFGCTYTPSTATQKHTGHASMQGQFGGAGALAQPGTHDSAGGGVERNVPRDTVLATNGTYSVIVRYTDTTAVLVTERHGSDGTTSIGEAISLDGLPYPEAQLITTDSGGALRVLSFDSIVENIIGTSVDYIRGSAVRREFADRETCKAAELERRQGGLFLRVYRSSPFIDYCPAWCADELRENAGIEPAKVMYLERVDERWVERGMDTTPAVLQGYRRAIDAIRNGRAPECRRDSTLLIRLLSRWSGSGNGDRE